MKILVTESFLCNFAIILSRLLWGLPLLASLLHERQVVKLEPMLYRSGCQVEAPEKCCPQKSKTLYFSTLF